ncbi:MAG: hypothetical protein ACYTDX_00215 [Planctomycetota bacterium]
MNRFTSLAVIFTLACGGVLTGCYVETADKGAAPADETPAKTDAALDDVTNKLDDAATDVKKAAGDAAAKMQTIVLDVEGMT